MCSARVTTPLSLTTISKIRSLSKQRRRTKRLLTEQKENVDLKVYQNERLKKEQQEKINDLIQTIKAMELIGGNTDALKSQLKKLLFPTK